MEFKKIPEFLALKKAFPRVVSAPRFQEESKQPWISQSAVCSGTKILDRCLEQCGTLGTSSCPRTDKCSPFRLIRRSFELRTSSGRNLNWRGLAVFEDIRPTIDAAFFSKWNTPRLRQNLKARVANFVIKSQQQHVVKMVEEIIF